MESNFQSSSELNILELIPHAFASLDSNGCYTYVNKRAGELFQRKPEDLIGKNIRAEFPESMGQPFHAAYNRAIKEQQSVYTEEYNPINDRWFKNHFYPSAAGISIFIEDVTERKKTEDELEVSREKYRVLSEAAFEAIFISENGICIEQNLAAEKIFGYTSEEAVGKNGIEWIAAEDREMVRKNMLEGYEEPYEATALRKDGTTFPGMIHGKMMHYQGRNVRVTSLRDISKSRQTGEALRESEGRFRNMADTAPVLIWMSDTDALCNYFNKPWLNFTGRTLEQELGNGWAEGVHPDDYQRCLDIYLGAFRERRTFEMEYRLRHNDGTYHWVLDSGVPRFTPDGIFTGYIGSCMDITDRKKAEMQFQEKTIQLEMLSNNLPEALIYQLENEPDGKKKFTYISKSIEHLTGKSSSEAMQNPSLFYSQVHEDDQQRLKDAERASYQNLSALDIEIRRRNLSGETRWSYIRSIPYKMADGRIIWNGIHLDITDRKKAEEQLHLAEGNYSSLINTVDGIVWEVDVKTFQFTYVSKQAERLLGYPVEQWINEPDFWSAHILEEDRFRAVSYCEKSTKEKKAHDFEYRIIAADGRIVWLHDIVTVMVENDEPVKLRGIMVDITERKKAEEELLKSKLQFQNLVENISGVYWVNDLETHQTLYISPSYETIFGRKCEDLYNNPEDFINAVHPEDKAMLFDAYSNLVNTNKVEISYRIVHINGEIRWISANVNVVIDSSGKKLEYGYAEDITERKKAEEEIQKSNERFELIGKATNDAVWEWNLETNELWGNEIHQQLYGLTLADPVPVDDVWKQRLHPEDQERVIKTVAEAIASERNNFDVEYRLYSENKGWINVYGSTYIERNKKGKAIRLLGSMMDITERKKAEEALRESEEIFRRLFNESADAILLLDDTGFIDCNQAAVSILGYSSRQEVVNKTPWEISPEKQPDGLLSTEKAEAMIAKALQQGHNRFEWVHTKADGTEFPVEVMLTSIILKGKQSFFTIWRDITERKKAEKKVEDYKFALDQSSIVDVSDSNGTIRFANENFCKISGYSMEELKGQNHRILNSGYHSKEHYKNLWDTVTTGKVWRGEVRNKAKDGSFFWVDTTIVPFVNEEGKPFQFITIRSDITKRKKAEASNMEALERYDLLSKATSDTIWDWDIKNNTVSCNNGIIKTFGYKASQVQKTREWWDLNVYPDDKQRLSDTLSKAFLKKKPIVQVEYRFKCADGTYKHVFDRSFVIYDKDGNPERMIGSMQDVTDEKEIEKRIEKAVIEAQERESNQIGMELHDNVNQILAASLLYMGLSKNSIKKGQDASDIIYQSEQYIGEAITAIRRLSHQLAPVSVEDISIEKNIEALIETININNRFSVKLQVGSIERNQIPEGLQINLYRILQEQLNNIAKHANASEVIISLTIEETRLKLRIADNGKGFNPRFQSKGIGLENIKRRAKVFSGEFKLKAAPGKGCEVVVEIPLAMQA